MIYINYTKKNITIIKGKVLGTILNIDSKNIINYWAKILEKLNIFYGFTRKNVIIVAAIVIVIVGLVIVISLLLIINIDIFI